jgi:hypothetical protein
MKKFFYLVVSVFVMSLIVISLTTKKLQRTQDRKLVREFTINYSKKDSEYLYYGYYKKIVKEYNYVSSKNKQVTVSYQRDQKSGKGIWIEAWVNEYGDTSEILYIDLTNYPRREDLKYAD